MLNDLTVVIPLYNKENTIARAIESVLQQSTGIPKIIVVDDGSADEGGRVVNKLSKKYPSITYLYQENQGVSSARNTGIENSDTKYISLLDADDVWLPDYLKNLFDLISSCPEADVYSLRYVVQTDSDITKPHVALPVNFKGVVQDFISKYSKGYGLIHSSTVCFSKEIIKKIGGFPVGQKSGEDIYVWLSLALEGKIAFYNKIGVKVYKQGENRRASIRREHSIPYHIKFFTKNLKNYSKNDQVQLKNFLLKNICIQWAASKVERNRWQKNILKEYSKELSLTVPVLLQISDLLPRKLFYFLKKVKNNRIYT